jgi:hypothetical protein
MAHLTHRGRIMKRGIAWVVLSGLLTLFGCASEPPKPSQPQPTYKDVRSDSDRMFDKMKQDEKEHGSRMKESSP